MGRLEGGWAGARVFAGRAIFEAPVPQARGDGLSRPVGGRMDELRVRTGVHVI